MSVQKKRIITQIGPIITRYCGGVVIEPFCGGLNATEWFVKQGLAVKASDSNRYLIALYDFLAAGDVDIPFVNLGEYQKIRTQPDNFPSWLVAWAAIGCSYGAKWWGGYADFTVTSGSNGTRTELRAYQLERRRSMDAIRELCRTVKPFESGYRNILPKNKTVYLDPPYRGTIKYVDQFNHNEFYGYCEKLKSRGNRLFISEYEMPSEFTEVWSSQLNCHLSRSGTSQAKIEKLYTL